MAGGVGGGRSSHGATSQITSSAALGGTQTGPEHLELLSQSQPLLSAHSFSASNQNTDAEFVLSFITPQRHPRSDSVYKSLSSFTESYTSVRM